MRPLAPPGYPGIARPQPGRIDGRLGNARRLSATYEVIGLNRKEDGSFEDFFRAINSTISLEAIIKKADLPA